MRKKIDFPAALITAALLLTVGLFPASAQNSEEGPVFPEENPSVILIEGEDAVSTNVALEPTLNYGASGSRTLQLNRNVGLQGDAVFFSEYVFYVQDEGDYRLWYGGTPPGPRDDLQPSYSSPFRYSVDGGEKTDMYREKMSVRGQYLPTFYWNETDTVHLSRGVHTIRFEIGERRRYDSTYLFYLDTILLLKEGTAVEETPKLFRDNIDPDSDIHFRTVAEYKELIAAEPESTAAYYRLSNIYSLLHNYVEALKILKQASVIDPKDAESLFLQAKNRLWKGDVTESLNLYTSALQLSPQRLDLWEEAAKIAAWTGNYSQAISIYTRGLVEHPDNPGLNVNLGLTYLWKSEPDVAERFFKTAEELALQKPESALRLADIYAVNGYPEYAEEVYRKGAEKFPRHLVFYLDLAEILAAEGRNQESESVLNRIGALFPSSPRLSSLIETFEVKQSLRSRIIDEYRERVTGNPDNLLLRQQLVETYFWNGLRDEAVREFINILGTHAYLQFRSMENNSEQLLTLNNLLYLYHDYMARVSRETIIRKQDLAAAARRYAVAKNNYQKWQDNPGELKEGEEDPESVYQREEEAWLSLITEILYTTDIHVSRVGEYKKLSEKVPDIESAEEKLQSSFNEAILLNGWEWDRQFYIDEWQKMGDSDRGISAYLQGRLLLTEERLTPGTLVLEEESQQGKTFTAVDETLFDAYVLQGNREKASELGKRLTASEEVSPRVQSTWETLNSISAGPKQEPASPRTLRYLDSGTELSEMLTELKESADTLLKQVEEDINRLQPLLVNRLIRNFYTLENNTYLLRYELGTYLLENNDYIAATEQFEKVLAIDPWNIDAQFRLAVVRQRYGDWYGAMKRYRSIYTQDPLYPNAAAYHNQLSRNHPDTFEIQTSLFADTSRIWFQGDISLSTALNTIMSWEGEYSFDHYRVYNPAGYQDNPSSHQLHGLSLRFPFDLYFAHLTLTPGAGLYFTSRLFERNGDTLITGGSMDLGEFLALARVSPAVTGRILFTPVNLSLSLDYAWRPVEETFVPERNLIREHFFELSAIGSLAGLEVPLLQYSSVRGTANLRIVDDANIIFTGAEELTWVIHLSDSPWANLAVVQNGSFEHSKTPSWSANASSIDPLADIDYYAPDSVFTLKGGVYGAVWLPLLRGNVLGISAGGYAGGNWERTLALHPLNGAFVYEFFGRLELTKQKTTYSLRLYAGRTIDVSDTSLRYWSATVDFGISARTPALLAP